MRKTKFTQAAAATALLTVGLAYGTAGAGVSSASSGASLTIGSQQSPSTFNPLVAAYMASHPGVKITVSYASPDSYPQLVQTEMQAGNAPDIIQSSPGTGFQTPLLTLGEAGRFADLSSASWVSQVPAVEKTAIEIGGKIYGYPTDQSPQLLFYNPNIFNKFGLSMPTTFSQLLTTCKTLSSKGVTPMDLAANGTAIPGTLADELAANLVYAQDPNWNAQRAAGKATFANTPAWNQVLQAVTQMKDADCFSSDVLTVTIPQYVVLFAAGKAAMTVAPAQAYGYFVGAHPAFTVKGVAFPGPTATQVRIASGSSAAWSVNSHASDKTAAEAFVAWLAQPAQQKTWATLNGVVTPLAASKGDMPAYMSSLDPYFKDGKVVPYINALWPNSSIWNDLGKGVEGLLSGQASDASILKQLDFDWALGNS